MRKIILITMAAIFAVGVMAQQKMRVWKNQSLVYEEDVTQIDSITFYDKFEGALIGEFSVSATKKVRFSKGNLQASTTDLGEHWTWSFAEHQWDYIGNASANTFINGDGTVSVNDTIDFFGWSTNATHYGINNSMNNSSYSGNFVDWGKTIDEGWHTLSKDEWVYLFYGRTDAKKLFGMGSVNGVNGTILLPDDWAGEKFTDTQNDLVDQGNYYFNENGSNFSFHTYTAEQWSDMEAKGSVFLPASGYRYGTIVYDVSLYGNYWSSTPYNDNNAYLVIIGLDKLDPQYDYNRWGGRSVRLVQDVK